MVKRRARACMRARALSNAEQTVIYEVSAEF